MAKFFIDRPIFAWVIAIFIILAGVIGIRSLPVSQYPSVGAPTITLTAAYLGASAQVMEDSVLSVIERNMNGVEDLNYMTTNATSSGGGTVSLTFTPETDESFAQVEVQNKLSEVTAMLPAGHQPYRPRPGHRGIRDPASQSRHQQDHPRDQQGPASRGDQRSHDTLRKAES